MQETANLKLKKPDYTDVADITDINANMDKLDEEVSKKANSTHNHNNGADLTNVNAAKLGGKLSSEYALKSELKTIATSGSYIDLINKPTSMPANGGNADTVDNKHASDFATYIVVNNGDFNNVKNPGLYTMRNCVNSPNSEGFYGLIVLKSDNGNYVEQMAFKEHTNKVYIRNLYGEVWSAWEEIGNKYAEKLRIFDVDGVTLKDTDGTNNLVFASPKQVTENEARITGFNTDKFWYNLGIANQTLKVPYSDLAIRALSFGTQAIPADTGMVRNVEGISTNIMNDCKYPVAYITRTSIAPFCPINGREFHILYFPSTKDYGTQIAISEQAFKGHLQEKDYTVRGVEIYMRSGQGRYTFDDESQKSDWTDDGYIVTNNDNSNEQKFLAADWSDWVKINSASNMPTSAISTASGSYSLSWSASNVQKMLENLAYQICTAKNSTGSVSSSLNNHSGASTNAHTANAISVSAIESTTYGNRTLITSNSNAQNIFQDLYNKLCYALDRSDDCLSKLIDHRNNEDGSGKQHIPSGGAWNNGLKYESSGKAVWTPNPYTYSKVSASLTYNNWYKLALCNFHSTDTYGGGSALITVHAYDGTGKEQTVVCRANYIGGNDHDALNDESKCNIEIVSSVYRGTKLFDKVSRVNLNTGFVAFHSAVSVTALTINITVESSISENRVDFKANDKEWDITVDGAWVWSYGGQHYWKDYEI